VGRKKTMEERDTEDVMDKAKESPVVGGPADSSPVAAPSMAGYVRVVNLTPADWGLTLTDGSHVQLGPWSKTGRTDHVSRPILRKLLPPVTKKMIHRGQLRIEEATS
jgi:hypothetical protein